MRVGNISSLHVWAINVFKGSFARRHHRQLFQPLPGSFFGSSGSTNKYCCRRLTGSDCTILEDVSMVKRGVSMQFTLSR